jgi:hypothetical protein
MKNSTADILCEVESERIRQIEQEGFDSAHDDKHKNYDLARAASCYAYEACRTDYQPETDTGNPPNAWPWAAKWWKPKDRRRDLIRAAALCVAEIERLDRA